MYAVVDIETTGGNVKEHKIIEIAIVIHDGNSIVESYKSFVNPGVKIPPYISSLTGIYDQDLVGAPTFKEIAVKINDFTKDKIFVAHNVNFDLSFLKKEFAELNLEFERKKLCTVRLSRKLLPGYRSYSLGSICEAKGIKINGRHRAMGDAEATAKLLSILLAQENAKDVLADFSKTRNKEMRLPPFISIETYDKLPNAHGVYFFHDQSGKIIYVGKAINIKDRVKQHFLGATHTKNREMFLNSIYKVSYKITGNELISLLLENEEIKKNYPKYNISNKNYALNYGLYKYVDQIGYSRVAINKIGKRDKPFSGFGTNAEAISYVLNKVHEYGLCLRLCGVIDSKIKCNYENPFGTKCPVCEGEIDVESYNQKVIEAFDGISKQNTFLIKTSGRNEDEFGYVMVENGRFLGYCYLEQNKELSEMEDLKLKLEPCYDTQDSQNIIKSFMKRSTIATELPIKIYQYFDNLDSF